MVEALVEPGVLSRKQKVGAGGRDARGGMLGQPGRICFMRWQKNFRLSSRTD
jgi:hypothetical protein